MTDIKESKLIEILLVEDNPGDAELTLEALSDNKVRNNVHVVEDGEEALDYLFKRGKYTNVPTPDLILLDLNLPKKNGQEVLKIIKEDNVLHDIPVVVLTSSTADKDRVRSYGLNANAYVVKPVELTEFFEVIRAISHFWVHVVKLPKVKSA